jgi:hypothetical protein
LGVVAIGGVRNYMTLQKFIMALQNIYEINAAGQLIIDVPKELQGQKKLRVILEDISMDRKAKIEMMAKAAQDPLYMQDMEEIENDFSDIGFKE